MGLISRLSLSPTARADLVIHLSLCLLLRLVGQKLGDREHTLDFLKVRLLLLLKLFPPGLHFLLRRAYSSLAIRHRSMPFELPLLSIMILVFSNLICCNFLLFFLPR